MFRNCLVLLATGLLTPLLHAEDLDKVLKPLDARAAELEARVSKEKGVPVHVAALLDRDRCDKLVRTHGFHEYSFSFEHPRRYEVEPTSEHVKTWDIGYGDGDALAIDQSTGDFTDRSFIWDLGEVDFDAFRVSEMGKNLPQPAKDQKAVPGHVYVVCSEGTLWAKIKVLELQPSAAVIFRWDIITDPADVRRLIPREGPDLERGRVRMQIQSGAKGNGDRMDMRGTGAAVYTRKLTEPFDPEAKLPADDICRAFVSGGLVPEGKVWILRSVDYAGTSDGDEPFFVHAGGKELARREAHSGAFKDTWKGRIVIHPGEEKTVFAGISTSSACDVVFHALLCDEKWADTESFPALGDAERKTVDGLLKELDADEAGKRDKAAEALLKMGPPIVDYLKGLRIDDRSAEFRVRFKTLLEDLQGE